MSFPEFFEQVPPILLYDPLAELFAAPADGLLRYTFADAVKLAGHACPTVAGAWLMTGQALAALYGDEIPQRGNIAIAFAAPLDSGVTGVIAAVAGLLTGAAGKGGFKGLGGQFQRRGLAEFAVAGVAQVRFTRLDNARQADCWLNPGAVPGDPRLGHWLGAILAGHASLAEQRQFQEAWQQRVRRILLEYRHYPELLNIELHREEH